MDEELEAGAGGKAPRARRGQNHQAAPSQAQPSATRTRGFFMGLLQSPLQAAASAVRGVLASPRGPAAEGIAQPFAAASNGDCQLNEGGPVATQQTDALPQNGVIQTKQAEGWSPSKLSSLAFFLKSSAPAAQALPPVSAARPAPSLDAQRPYLGLKFLLQAGPGGSGLPSTWIQAHRQQAAGPDSNTTMLQRNRLGYVPQPATSGRFAPYSLGNPARLHAAGGQVPPTQVPGSFAPLALTPPRPVFQLATQPDPSTTFTPMAAAQSTPAPAVNPFFSVTPIAAKPTPMAGLSGRPSPPPQLSPLPPAATPALKLGQATPGAWGRALAGSTPAPPSAAVSLKRGRDTNAAGTPLVGSGIKNLAEYKRQRQRYTQPPSAWPTPGALTPGWGTPAHLALANGSACPSPTASGSGSATPAQQRAAVLAGAPTHGAGTTETARKILETLGNLANVADGTPTMAGKPGAATPYSAKAGHTGNAGHTPFPSQREPPPPLDRITPQDTPTQSTGAGARLVSYGLSFASTIENTTPAPVPLSGVPATAAAASFPPGFVLPPSVALISSTDSLAGVRAGSGGKRSAEKAPKSVRWAVPDEEAVAEGGQSGGPPGKAGPGSPTARTVSPKAALAFGEAAAGGAPEAASELLLPQANARRSGTRGDGPAPSTRRAALDFSAAGPGSTLAPQSQPPAQSPTMVWPTPPAQFTFGGAEDDTSRLVRNISQAVEASGGTVSMGMSPPTFSFGAPQPALQASAPAVAQPAVPVALQPVPVQFKTLQTQVAQAAAVPLPDDEDEEQGVAQQAAPDPAQPSPVPAATGGWGTDFLQKSQAAFSAASYAVAKEVEKANAPAPTPTASAPVFSFGITPTPGPAAGGSSGPASTPTLASTPMFGSPTQTQGAGLGGAAVLQQEPSTGAAATAVSAPAPAPAATGGWDMAFLQKSQAAMSAASDATAQEIDKAKGGGSSSAAPAATSGQPTFAFGSTPVSWGPAAGSAASPVPFSFGGNGGAPAASPLPGPSSSPGPSFGAFGTAVATAPSAGSGVLFGNASSAAPFGFQNGAVGGTESSSLGSGSQPQAQGGQGGASASTLPFTFGAGNAPSEGGVSSSAPVALQPLFSSAPTPTVSFAPTPAAGWGTAPLSWAPAATPAFGASQGSAPNFGAQATTPTFGGQASAPSFGGQVAAPTFGGQAAAPTFGAPQGQPAASSAAAFGFNPPQSSPGAFSFGNLVPAPAPSQAAASTTPTNPFGFPSAAPPAAWGVTPPPAAAPAGFGGFGGGGGAPFGSPSPAPSMGFFGATPGGAGGNGGGAGHTPYHFGGQAGAFGGLATPPTISQPTTMHAGATPFPGTGGPGGGGSSSPFGAMPTQPSFGGTPSPASTPGGFGGFGGVAPAPAGFGGLGGDAGAGGGGGGGGGGFNMGAAEKSGDRRKVRAVRKH